MFLFLIGSFFLQPYFFFLSRVSLGRFLGSLGAKRKGDKPILPAFEPLAISYDDS